MPIIRLYLVMLVLAWQFTLAGSVASPEWSYEFGESVGQLAPYPNSEHAEGVLLTGNPGKIRLLAPGGHVLSSMQLNLSQLLRS